MQRNIQPRLIYAPTAASTLATPASFLNLRENQMARRKKTIITDPSYFLSCEIIEAKAKAEDFIPTSFTLTNADFKGLSGIGVTFLDSSPQLTDYDRESFLVDETYVDKKMYFNLKRDKDEMFRLSKEWDSKLPAGETTWKIYDIIRDMVYLDPTKGRSIFMNRAAIKLANMDFLYNFTAITTNAVQQDISRSVFYFADIAAGPGGFTEYLQYRIPTSSGFGITLSTSDVDRSLLWNEKRLDLSRFKTFVGPDASGDIYRFYENFSSYVLNNAPDNKQTRDVNLEDLEIDNNMRLGFKFKDSYGLHLVTADGGFDLESGSASSEEASGSDAEIQGQGKNAPSSTSTSLDLKVAPLGDLHPPASLKVAPSTSSTSLDLKVAPRAEPSSLKPIQQEFASVRLIFCEMMVAIETLQNTGNFICKIFDTVSTIMNQAIYLMSICFNTVSILKPYSSRPNNTERYLICQLFRGRTFPLVKTVHTIFDHILRVNRGREIRQINNLIIPEKFRGWIRDQNEKSIKYQDQETSEILLILRSGRIKTVFDRQLRKLVFKIPELVGGDNLYLPNFFTLWNIPESLKRGYHPRLISDTSGKKQGQIKFPYIPKTDVNYSEILTQLLVDYHNKTTDLVLTGSPVRNIPGHYITFEINSVAFGKFYATVITTGLDDVSLMDLFIGIEEKKLSKLDLINFFMANYKAIEEKSKTKGIRLRNALDIVSSFSYKETYSFNFTFAIFCFNRLKEVGIKHTMSRLVQIMDQDGSIRILDPFFDWGDRLLATSVCMGVKNYTSFNNEGIDYTDILNTSKSFNRTLTTDIRQGTYLESEALEPFDIIFTKLEISDLDSLVILVRKFITSLRIQGFCVLYINNITDFVKNQVSQIITNVVEGGSGLNLYGAQLHELDFGKEREKIVKYCLFFYKNPR